MKICFLIVIYNKELLESTTFKSIVEIQDKNFDCLIVNNGPHEINFSILKDFNNINFKYIQCLDNKPLSYLYNNFIKSYSQVDRYVILDDDSVFSKSFIKRIFDGGLDSFDLELPKIFDKNNKLYYPLRNWAPIEEHESFFNYKDEDIFSIGSGLIISKKLVNIFNNKNIKLFNEAFAFYGVDFSLFWELKKHNFGELKITSVSKISHDMSLHNEITDFKRKELYINFALQMRYYPSIINLKNFIYCILKSIKMYKISMVISILKAYFFAKHPKC